MQILQLLISLSLLVVIHEMGHFIFARIFGVRVERFSLFFGKPLLRFKPKRSETEYVVGWIPFGGYVELSGMIDESLNMEQMQQPPQPWEFRTKPAWQRLLIMVGGVLFNLIIACFIYAMVLFHWGDTYRTLENPKYGMEFNERAEAMGFRDGDILLRADDTPLKRYDENMLRALVAAHEVTVLRQGVEHIITMPEDMSLLDFGKDVQPFIDYYVPLTLDSVAAGSGAAQAGLQAGDRIISINGKAADTRVTFNTQLNLLRQQEKEGAVINHDLNVVYSRDGVLDTVVVSSDANFMLGIYLTQYNDCYAVEHYGFFASLPAGVAYGWNVLSGYVSDLKYVFSKEGAQSLGGFGTIASLFPKAWDWYLFWTRTAFISIMLAFMNILPIPALDGGHVLFLLAEVITRRKPSEKFLYRAQIVGMVILFGLLIFANLNDVLRWLHIL